MEYKYLVCVGILCVLPSFVDLQYYCDWPDVQCGTSCCNENQWCKETSSGPACTQMCGGEGLGCPDNNVCCIGTCCKSNQKCTMGSCQDAFLPGGSDTSGVSSSEMDFNYGIVIGPVVGGVVFLSICSIVLRLWYRARLIRRLTDDGRRTGVVGIFGVLTVTRTVEHVPDPDPAAFTGQRGTVPEPPPYSQTERPPVYSDYRVESDQKKLVDI